MARSSLCTIVPSALAPGQPGDGGEVAALGDLLDGEIELVARDEIDRRGRFQALLRLDRDLGADHADLEAGLARLERLRRPHIGGKGGRGGVQHDEVAVDRFGRDVLEFQPVRRRVDQFRPFDQRGRLGEPGRIPERSDFAAHLIARAGAAIVAVERGGLQKQGAHHGLGELPAATKVPPGSKPVAPALPARALAEKLDTNTAKENRSRSWNKPIRLRRQAKARSTCRSSPNRHSKEATTRPTPKTGPRDGKAEQRRDERPREGVGQDRAHVAQRVDGPDGPRPPDLVMPQVARRHLRADMADRER